MKLTVSCEVGPSRHSACNSNIMSGESCLRDFKTSPRLCAMLPNSATSDTPIPTALEKSPNLYGDNSAFNVPNRRIRSHHLARCLDETHRGRIVHGSDTPVPVLGHGAYVRGHVSRRAFKLSRAETNPLERDYQLKRALGFPEESFTRASQLVRLCPVPGR